MTFSIQIACDNAAFDHENLGPELARILRHEAAALEDSGIPEMGSNSIQDINGNRVGCVTLDD